MFRGEKSVLFWAGLIILGFASVFLFTTVWQLMYITFLSQSFYFRIPMIVGGIVFILIGFYMMKSGVKRGQPPTQN